MYVRIDGFDQIGKSGPSGSASEKIANALGSIFSAVSEFFSDEGENTDSDSDTDNQNEETNMEREPQLIKSDTSELPGTFYNQYGTEFKEAQVIDSYSDGTKDTSEIRIHGKNIFYPN